MHKYLDLSLWHLRKLLVAQPRGHASQSNKLKQLCTNKEYFLYLVYLDSNLPRPSLALLPLPEVPSMLVGPYTFSGPVFARQRQQPTDSGVAGSTVAAPLKARILFILKPHLGECFCSELPRKDRSFHGSEKLLERKSRPP